MRWPGRSVSSPVVHWPVISALALAAGLCAVPTLEAQPSGIVDGIRIPQDGYLYTLHSSTLTDARHNGITLEAWLWLNDVPPEYVLWPFIHKDHSYQIVFGGREGMMVIGQMKLRLGYSDWDGNRLLGATRIGIRFQEPAPHLWPLRQWTHLAYQIKDEGGTSEHVAYVNGTRLDAFLLVGKQGFGLGSSDSPLLVAGLSPETRRAYLADGAHKLFTIGTIDGWIGELRISRGWRYGGVNPRQPVLGGAADRSTIALWTFDRAPAVAKIDGKATLWFPDESGHDHKLVGGGSLIDMLAVTASPRATTTWATLKEWHDDQGPE